MKKKGFTLVELLAVIAILAILVIIALPNVMGMFNTAKKNSFSTEVKEMMKVAEQQWISSGAMNATTESLAFGRGVTCNNLTLKPLDLSGRTNINYFFVLNKAGKITHLYASDGTYVIYKTDTNGINAEDIKTADGKTSDNKVDGSVRTISDFNKSTANFSCSYNSSNKTFTTLEVTLN